MNDIKYTDFYDLINLYNNHVSIIKDKYLSLLSNLSSVSNISNFTFIDNILNINKFGLIYVAYYLPNNDINNIVIVASGTVIFEPKLFRGGKAVARIEDIVVLNEYRNKGIAKHIINYLISFSSNRSPSDTQKYFSHGSIKNTPVYKIILVSNNHYTDFYKKFNFSIKDNNMVLYL